MHRIAVLLVAILLLAGCQAKPRTATSAAAAPNVIVSLTDQKVVWECPKCGMDYDGPGQCSMCSVALEKTDVAYLCPADDKGVDKAGKCPRCNMDAKVVKTAAAEPAPAGATTGSSQGS